MKQALDLAVTLELLALLMISILTFANGNDKALIIRLDEENIKNSDAIIADLNGDEQQRSRKYLSSPYKKSSPKYADADSVTGMILDKELSYVLLRPEDAQHFKLDKSREDGDSSPKYLLIPERDLRPYNRSDYGKSSYQVPVKHNTISVEVIRDKDSSSEPDLRSEKYTVTSKTISKPVRESTSVGISHYGSNSDEKVEPGQRKLLSTRVLLPRSPRAPRAPAFLIRRPIPRYYTTDNPYSPYPHTKPEYGQPAPNFAGPRLYRMPPPGPFRSLLGQGPQLYHQGPKYISGSPVSGPFHYSPIAGPIRTHIPQKILFRGGPSKFLLSGAPPRSVTKVANPPYYLSPSSYAKKGKPNHINEQYKPSYYVDSEPNLYNKKQKFPPSIEISDYITTYAPSFYETSEGKPYHKDYAQTLYSHSRPPPPPPPENTNYSPPHRDMYKSYKTKKHPFSGPYESNSATYSNKPTTYGNSGTKSSPISPNYLRNKPPSYESPSHYHKDYDSSSYESPDHYSEDSHSSHESPTDYHKDSHSYRGPLNDYSKDTHSTNGLQNDYSGEIQPPYKPSSYSQDPASSYESPHDHVKDSYGPPPDYSKDSHSSYGRPLQPLKNGPSSYHHPPKPPPHSYEKPSYFTEHDAIPPPAAYQNTNNFEPVKKPPISGFVKQFQHPQALEISSEMPDYHKAKTNYEPVRPPPKSSLTVKKLYPPLPHPRKVQSSDEEDQNKGSHYDHHYHYDHNHAPPTTNQNYKSYPEYNSHPQSHSKTLPSTSYSSSDHATYPHSGERTYYPSPNTPSHYHSEPGPHSSEEYDETYNNDKPTAASKSYVNSEPDYVYQWQSRPEKQYKSYTVPENTKPRYNNAERSPPYVIERPPSQTSTHVDKLPPKPNQSPEEELKEHHRVRKIHKRPRLKYGVKPSRPQKDSYSGTQAGYAGVWHDYPLPFKQSVPESKHISNEKGVSSEKNAYEQTSNSYNENPNSFEDSYEYPIEDSKAAIPGQPGKDYPVLHRIPTSDFNCHNKPPGFYADIANRCQVYYQCSDKGAVQSFLCPNGTIFNQETFVCEWWHNVNCANSEQHFSRNNDLYKIPEPKQSIDEEQPVPQFRRSPMKKLRYSGPSVNSHQPYRDRPVYHPHSHHHQAYDYKESRPSADYEPYGSATQNKEQYAAPAADKRQAEDVKTHHIQEEEEGKPSKPNNNSEVFGAKKKTLTKNIISSNLKTTKKSI